MNVLVELVSRNVSICAAILRVPKRVTCVKILMAIFIRQLGKVRGGGG